MAKLTRRSPRLSFPRTDSVVIAGQVLATQVGANDVVVTHHLPAFESVPARFARSAMNAFFVCDMAAQVRER